MTRLHRQLNLSIRGGQVICRRDFLRGISGAALAGGALSFRELMALEAPALRRGGKACILLWMQGGPSQFETFSPKPDHPNGGQTKAIATSVPGIQISENFPQVGAQMQHLALVRSMTSKEGSHPRATFLLHTGYLPTASVKYPALGSIVANELGHAGLELPAFVRIGNVQNGSGGGLLGSEFDPFVMPVAGKLPANATLPTREERFERRLDLLSRLECDYAHQSAQDVDDHQKLYRKAARMIESPQMKAFDLDAEPAAMRSAYGSGSFASGCLLARRLVEAGVTFVEVISDGWDTHADNFGTSKRLAAGVDQPFAALIADLLSRGLLDSTLVVWMGEFGRTPKINPRWPRSLPPGFQRRAGRRRRARRTGDRPDGCRRHGSDRAADQRARPVPFVLSGPEDRSIQGKHEYDRPADQAGRRGQTDPGFVRPGLTRAVGSARRTVFVNLWSVRSGQRSLRAGVVFFFCFARVQIALGGGHSFC